MEDRIVVKEEPMSEGDEDQEMEVEIKQEMLIWDEYVKEEVGNSRTDEDAGCPMIKQEDSSAADPLCDERDVLQGSIGVQRTEAGPAPLECLCTYRVDSVFFSDHFPQIIELNSFAPVEAISAGQGEVVAPVALRWRSDLLQDYQKKLHLHVGNLCHPTLPELCSCIIKSSDSYVRRRRKSEIPKQPWYDLSCVKRRRRVFALLNLMRDTDSDIIVRQYRQSVKDYKEHCALKKIEQKKSVALEMCGARDGREFWSLVAKHKILNFVPKVNIPLDDWVVHFSALYNPPQTSPSVMYAAPFIENPFLDADFSMGDLKRVLGKAKLGKAPGFIISTDDKADSCVHCNQHISEMALGDSWSICSVCSETAHDSCSGFDPDKGKPFVCTFCTDLVPQIHMKCFLSHFPKF
ncbi:hypothetical protein GE061_008821 [Apolygus lucorum]|uniref:Uncharacterized protein n=1 Tax=Apolygus lucorum TaxID=248454 RepID=A0A8S9WNX4_APOLU|nr:hypothetical protein GE061_008821 [Apolygus lucorum]